MGNQEMKELSEKLSAYLIKHPNKQWAPYNLETKGVIIGNGYPKTMYMVEFKNDDENKNAMSVINFMEENNLTEPDL